MISPDDHNSCSIVQDTAMIEDCDRKWRGQNFPSLFSQHLCCGQLVRLIVISACYQQLGRFGWKGRNSCQSSGPDHSRWRNPLIIFEWKAVALGIIVLNFTATDDWLILKSCSSNRTFNCHWKCWQVLASFGRQIKINYFNAVAFPLKYTAQANKQFWFD